jgi:hypothetical protein
MIGVHALISLHAPDDISGTRLTLVIVLLSILYLT